MTTVIDTADRQKHSEWGGSVAYRVINCAGSVALNRSVPKRPAGYAAEEGTWMHALAAYCLEEGRRTCSAFTHTSLPLGVEVPEQFSGHVFGPDRVAAVQAYLDAVWEEFDRFPGAELYVEVDVEFGVEGVFGRCDAVVRHAEAKRLRCFDLKGGEGMEVDAEENDQAQFYTVSLLRTMAPKWGDWRPEDLVMTIVQPRHWTVLSNVKEAAQDWEVHPLDLELWAMDYEEAVQRSIMVDNVHGDGHTDGPLLSSALTAGPWCAKTFCDAMAVCPAHEGQALEVAKIGFQGTNLTNLGDVTAVELAAPSQLDIGRLEKMAAAAKMLAAYAQKCEDYLYGLAMNGHPLTLHKVVDKVGRRKYVVADEEVTSFLDLMFGIPTDVSTRTQLQTLTEMKKILKQHGATTAEVEDFELRFTLKESSGTTLAPISDKRPAVAVVEHAFAGVALPTA